MRIAPGSSIQSSPEERANAPPYGVGGVSMRHRKSERGVWTPATGGVHPTKDDTPDLGSFIPYLRYDFDDEPNIPPSR